MDDVIIEKMYLLHCYNLIIVRKKNEKEEEIIK